MKISAAHILVPTLEDAVALQVRLNAGEDFAVLAKAYSKCPSGSTGGHLGFFDRGQMVKEFEYSAFETKVGSISAPVQTQFGYHLIKRLY